VRKLRVDPGVAVVVTTLAVAAGLVTLYLSGLGGTLPNSDEAIYAEFIRTMHRTGDYLTVSWQGHPVLQRPAAPIALYAAVSAVVDGERGLRLLPALLSAAAALAAGGVVWARTRRLGAALAAAVLCAAAPSYYVYGRLLFSDPPFVLATTGALAAMLAARTQPRAFLWIGVCLGAAFASKSLAAAVPAAGLLPGIVLAVRRHPRRALRLPATVVAFAALAAPFYLIGLVRYGGQFVAQHLGYNVLARARGLPGIGLGASPAAYLEHMISADGPLLTALFLGAPVVGALVAVRRRDPELGLAAAFAAITFVALSAVGTHVPHYLLVFYPAAAVTVGLLVGRAQVQLAEHFASRNINGANHPAGESSAAERSATLNISTAERSAPERSASLNISAPERSAPERSATLSTPTPDSSAAASTSRSSPGHRFSAAASALPGVAAALPGVAAALVGAAALWVTSGRPSFDANTYPADEARELGAAAGAATAPGQAVYSLDWYAPAFGYYADRDWKLLGTSGGWMKFVGSVDLFQSAGTVRLAPPWPDGRFLVAGARVDLDGAAGGRGLHRLRVVAATGDFALWEAEAAPP
jgi:dolichyl-phosphate-mannose-protein mannosyltransferase